jgi:multicomponent Na+:H+ antiporter subunit B
MSTIIAKTISKACLIPSLLFSIYLLLNGANYPGGGFVGGVLFVCSIAMVYVTYGMKYINARLKPNWWMWFAYGLLFASIAAWAPLFAGHNFFRSAFEYFHIELFGIHLGELELASAMYFDVGIYFVVIGSLLFILTSIADDKVKEPKSVDIEQWEETEGEMTLKPKEPLAREENEEGSDD